MKIVGENYRDETRLEHMFAALLRIRATASKVTRDQLFLDDVVTRALMYDFTVLGEAANNVSESYCKAHPELDWKGISGFRHKLIHDYAGIEYGILWDSITVDVPELLPKVKRLVDAIKKASAPKNIGDFF